MTIPSGLAAGLATLTEWLSREQDSSLEAKLRNWASSMGWPCAGLILPTDSGACLSLRYQPEGVTRTDIQPSQLEGVIDHLKTGGGTIVLQTGEDRARLYCLIAPPCRQLGVIWAERPAAERWPEVERNFMRLSARLIERLPALVEYTGSSIDAARLQLRLQDASVIAGRMAHEFDNILTGIIGFADLTAQQLPEESNLRRFVTEISQVGQRGIHFTRQLHQLSRSGNRKPNSGNVAVVVSKESARLRPGLAAGAEIMTSVPANLASVAMDEGPLAAVIGHLMSNAVEATPPGGRVTVTARVVDLSEEEVLSYLGSVNPGPHVEVTVQDSGPGIRPDVRAKLFAEPFHTTKVRHRGLGLAIVYRTLYAHQAGVRLDAAHPPETGTVVRVVIPPATVRSAVATSNVASNPVIGG